MTTGTPTDTGLTVSITPSANTSKVLILCWFPFRSQNTNNTGNCYSYWRLLKDGNTIPVGFPQGVVNFGASSNKQFDTAVSFSYLDSPATTSSVTYKIQIFVGDSTTADIKGAEGTAQIIACEIGA